MDERTRAALRARWAALAAPHEVGEELLRRWAEPHRVYHGPSHLVEALDALALLGGGRTEALALWFHDAVFTGGPDDEAASAALARARLTADPEALEVTRLVLITREHRPDPTDGPGARVADADLWNLGAEPERYRVSVAALRAEQPGVPDESWVLTRTERVRNLLSSRLFHTPLGRSERLPRARANLATELAQLARSASAG